MEWWSEDHLQQVMMARSKINSDSSNNYIILHSWLYVILTMCGVTTSLSLPAGKRPYYPRNKHIPTVRLRYEVGLQIDMKSAHQLYLHTKKNTVKVITQYWIADNPNPFQFPAHDSPHLPSHDRQSSHTTLSCKYSHTNTSNSKRQHGDCALPVTILAHANTADAANKWKNASLNFDVGHLTERGASWISTKYEYLPFQLS